MNCSVKSTQRRQDALRSFLSSFSLNINSTSDPTFHHNNGISESIIDYFVASSSLVLEKLVQYCTIDQPLNLSSHDPVSTIVTLEDTEFKPSNFAQHYSGFNPSKVIWADSRIPQYQALAAKALHYACSNWNTPECIPLLMSMVSNLLVSCARSVFRMTKPGKPSQSKSSMAILQSEKLVIKYFKAWKAAGKPESKSNTTRALYTKERSELQKVRRRQEHLQHIRKTNFLIHSSRHDRNKVYARMKRCRIQQSNFSLHQHYIFEFEGDNPIRIPPMNIFQLEDILKFKMKSGKSCDTYHFTVEHLCYCGIQAKTHILNLINGILHDIYYLTCPQAKLGLGTALHKGKGKSFNMSNSYRRITVSPILGAIIDHYIDPVAEALFRQVQSRDQLGFTSGISYLLAAVVGS